MPNDKEKSPQGQKQTGTPALQGALCASLVVLLILISAASFLPDKRLWGVNHLAFYPLPARIIALILMSLSFLPPVARKIYALVAGSLDILMSRRRLLMWLMVIISLTSIFIFFHFQSSTLLLGDGHLVVRNFEYASEGYTNVVTRDIKTILEKIEIAKGATILYYIAVKISEEIFSSTPVNGIKAFNCILGGIFIFIFLRIFLLSSIPAELRIWLAILVLSSGTMELFFGYVENYTPLIFFASLFLLSGFFLIHRSRKYWIFINLLCLLIGIFIHVQATLLVPSFLFLLVWTLAGKHRETALRWLTPSLAALILAGTFIARAFTGFGKHILTLRTTGDFYGIITPSHWLDILNELLILMPTFFLFVIMAALTLRRTGKRSIRDETMKKPGKPSSAKNIRSGEWFSLKAEWHFTLLLLVPSLLFLVLFKPEIGMPRDWDLFTLTFLGLLPLALLIMNRFLKQTGIKAIYSITVPAAVMSILAGIAWIGVNAAPSRAAGRFEQILGYDRTNSNYVYEILSKHYYGEHQLDKAITVIEEAVSFSQNPRMYLILSNYYEESGRIDDAIDALYKIPQKWTNLEYAEWARRRLVTLLDRTGQYVKLEEVARDGTQNHPDKPIFHFFLGKSLLVQDRFKEGIEELNKCKSLNPPPAVSQQIDDVLKRLETEGKL